MEPDSSAVKVERVALAGANAPIDDATVVVFTVVVVLGVDDGDVREGITTPDLGRVISPIGLIMVGPTGALRGTKMIPTTPAAMSTKHAAVHQNRDGRLLFEDVTTLNVVEPGSKFLSPYARRRRRRTSPRPARPKKRSRMLKMSTPPLTEDVAAPPSPVPGAPEGIVAGGICGDVVGGPLLIVVVDVIGGIVVVVVDVVEVVDVVDVVPGGVVCIVVDVTGIVDVVDVVDVVDDVVVVPGNVDGVVGIVVDVTGIVDVVDVVDEEDVVEVVTGEVVDVVDCELTVNGSQSPVEPGYDAVPLPV